MDRFDKSMAACLQEELVLPDIVERKCSSAYDAIRATNDSGDNYTRTKTRKTHRALKIGAPLAACMALFIGVCAANPAFAAKIPLVGNVFSLFQKDSTLGYKEPLAGGAQGDYAVPVNVTATDKGIAFTVQQAYCDGENLLVTYGVDTASFADATRLSTDMGVALGGQPVTFSGQTLTRTGDTTYVAMGYADISALNLPDSFEARLTTHSVTAVNDTVMVYNYDRECYEPQTSEPVSGTWSFCFQVKSDAGNNKVYKVDAEQNGVTLKSLTLTACTTEIDMDVPVGMEDASLQITDNNGNKLEPIGSGKRDATNSYSVTLKDAASLTVTLIDTTKDEFPALAKFTVPIDGGFGEPAPEKTYAYTAPTYIPPIDEIPKKMLTVNEDCVFSIDEIVTAQDFTYKINKVTVTKDSGGIPQSSFTYLTDDETAQMDANGLLTGDKSYVFVNISIKNNLSENVAANVGNSSIGILNKIERGSSSELRYIDKREYGGTAYYHFDFKAGEEKALTFGYILNDSSVTDPSLWLTLNMHGYSQNGQDSDKIKYFALNSK